jgi:hypothetical protein
MTALLDDPLGLFCMSVFAAVLLMAAAHFAGCGIAWTLDRIRDWQAGQRADMQDRMDPMGKKPVRLAVRNREIR